MTYLGIKIRKIPEISRNFSSSPRVRLQDMPPTSVIFGHFLKILQSSKGIKKLTSMLSLDLKIQKSVDDTFFQPTVCPFPKKFQRKNQLS